MRASRLKSRGLASTVEDLVLARLVGVRPYDQERVAARPLDVGPGLSLQVPRHHVADHPRAPSVDPDASPESRGPPRRTPGPLQLSGSSLLLDIGALWEDGG